MKLWKKSLILSSILLMCTIICILVVSKIYLETNYIVLEERETYQNIERIMSALEKEISDINSTCRDYAEWDATYNFVEDVNQKYIKTDFQGALEQNNLNLVVFINLNGEVVYSKSYDCVNKEEKSATDGIQEFISKNKVLLNHNDKTSSANGFILFVDKPMLIVSRPIITTEYKGPIRGTLLMGRYLDEAKIKNLAEITHLSLVMHKMNDAEIPEDFQMSLRSFTKDDPYIVRTLSPDTIAGYAQIKDIYGNPIVVLRVDLPRDIYQQVLTHTRNLIIVVVFISVLVIMVSYLTFEKLVISRLAKIIQDINDIEKSNDISKRVSINGGDELKTLADRINGMLEKIEIAYKSRTESEEKFRSITSTARDGIILIDNNFNIAFWNEAAEQIFGYTAEEVIGQKKNMLMSSKYLLSNYQMGSFNGVGKGHIIGKLHELTARRKDGTEFPIELSVSSFKMKGQWFATGIVRDITERKRAEERLKQLSIYDSLTNLYNRAFFEEEIRRLDKEGCCDAGIVVCDLDGLKLVNDTFGHKTGDALLIAAAEEIKKCIYDCDCNVVARIGGDEFAVIIRNSNNSIVTAISSRVRDAISKYNEAHPKLPLSISVGFASNIGGNSNIFELLKEADDNMYREKLHRSQSTRNSIVKALMKALESRDCASEEHVERLQKMMVELVELVERNNLPQSEMNNLRLLAQFHDIGKVGIPDRILLKPGPLTPEERSEMERHCEIGLRIAVSVPDLAHIANLILMHHEWWNGEGYPLRLKGEEIPLECRILAIVDAYDAMTNDRPYRKAMSQEAAILELKRFKGTQFDPYLVEKFIKVMEFKK